MLPTIAVLIRDNAVGSVKLSSFEGKQQAPDSNTPVVLIFFWLTTLLISSSTAVADNSLRVAQQQQPKKKNANLISDQLLKPVTREGSKVPHLTGPGVILRHLKKFCANCMAHRLRQT